MALPNYLSFTGHGSSCGEPPAVFTGATMHLFGLTAAIGAMQALADRFLAPVTAPGVTYTAFIDKSLLTIVDIEKGTSSVEAVGWLPGRECALWIPLIETTLPTLSHPLPKLRLVMWSPYIFISYAIGMATGREVWGWAKALANIDLPATGSSAPKFEVKTVIFRTLDATKPGGEEVLLSVTGKGLLDSTPQWASLQQAATEVMGKFVGILPPGVANSFLLTAEFPAIALKQFRDASSPNLACYQAVTNSPVQIKNFGGGGFRAATFDVEIATCASHPIVEKFLGKPAPMTPSTIVSTDWAAWVKFDFDALPGSVIAQTT